MSEPLNQVTNQRRTLILHGRQKVWKVTLMKKIMTIIILILPCAFYPQLWNSQSSSLMVLLLLMDLIELILLKSHIMCCVNSGVPCIPSQLPWTAKASPQGLLSTEAQIRKHKTPHGVSGKLNTIRCFCWNCCSRLAGFVISLHTAVPAKLRFIKA